MKTKHKQELVEIITLYKRRGIPKVEMVKCAGCDTVFPELMTMFQNRENITYRMYGGKSPVIFLNPKIKWAKEKVYESLGEIDIKYKALKK